MATEVKKFTDMSEEEKQAAFQKFAQRQDARREKTSEKRTKIAAVKAAFPDEYKKLYAQFGGKVIAPAVKSDKKPSEMSAAEKVAQYDRDMARKDAKKSNNSAKKKALKAMLEAHPNIMENGKGKGKGK